MDQDQVDLDQLLVMQSSLQCRLCFLGRLIIAEVHTSIICLLNVTSFFDLALFHCVSIEKSSCLVESEIKTKMATTNPLLKAKTPHSLIGGAHVTTI